MALSHPEIILMHGFFSDRFYSVRKRWFSGISLNLWNIPIIILGYFKYYGSYKDRPHPAFQETTVSVENILHSLSRKQYTAG